MRQKMLGDDKPTATSSFTNRWSSRLHGFFLHLCGLARIFIVYRSVQVTSRLNLIIVISFIVLFRGFCRLVWPLLLSQQGWLLACTVILGFSLGCASSTFPFKMSFAIFSELQNSTILLRPLVDESNTFMSRFFYHSWGGRVGLALQACWFCH